MTLDEVYATVSEASRLLVSVVGKLPPELSIEAAYELGRATGNLMLAKNIIEQDCKSLKEPKH